MAHEARDENFVSDGLSCAEHVRLLKCADEDSNGAKEISTRYTGTMGLDIDVIDER